MMYIIFISNIACLHLYYTCKYFYIGEIKTKQNKTKKMSKRENELETFNIRDQCLNRTTTQLLKSKLEKNCSEIKDNDRLAFQYSRL